MKVLRRACSLVFLVILLLTSLAGYSRQEPVSGEGALFTSFRDVPGVTQREIDAIEELQKSREAFVYASIYGTEMFYGEDGKLYGFSTLICNWLSELFDMPFLPEIRDWDDLIGGLETGAVDFTGELTATDERRGKYFMTNNIAQRQIIAVRAVDVKSLQGIAETRPLRYAFLDGANTADLIREREKNKYEELFVATYAQAYEMLQNGKADAFFTESSTEAAFKAFGEVAVDLYSPLTFSPVSLTTQNPQLEPVISIVQKALENGDIRYMTDLYNQGSRDYMKYEFSTRLTDAEREYIKNHPIIPYAAEATHYPVSFYDTRSGKWEGIAIDLIGEIEKLTDLTFKRENDENTNWPDLLKMLETGRVVMLTELIASEDRRGDFLWAGEHFLRDSFVLVSKTEFRDINISEIIYIRIGMAEDTAYSSIFKSWFSDHDNMFEYSNTYEAFNALERGEVDMVITSEHQLLTMTNYRELTGYKENVVFDLYFDMTFGFSKDEAVLCSIITKAMGILDVESISGRWMRKTYDYRVKLLQERTPFIIGAGVLFIVLVCVALMFFRKRSEGKRLEKLVEIRTKELSEQQLQLMEAVEIAQDASRAKTEFLANMSHEIRTPMNSVIGMLKLLEYEKLTDRQMGYIKDMNISAHALLEIINDILDMSKIEAGKHELYPVDYSLHQFKDNIASVFTHIAYRKDLKFEIEIEDGIPDCLYGDDMRLRQVLINICGNAVKFTEKGYIKINIAARGDKLVFRVEDTGLGIREEDLPNLFNVFEQFHVTKNRKAVGTGLGLSISKAFIELMGGDISVESEYGHGSVFTISIPLIPGDIKNIRNNDTIREDLLIRAPDAKILVTDDNRFNLKVASGLLGLMDIKADLADSGLKAIEMIKEKDYDIVFMDHMMPGMDGIETVKNIRNLGGKYEELTIVALTANAIKDVWEMFYDNGFTNYLSKPIDTGELREIIKRYVPHEKVKLKSDPEEQPAGSDKEMPVSRKTISIFVKENENTFDNLTAALDTGDIATAHMIAHTLKSSAGYLGKTDLQAAALSLERSLQDKSSGYTPAQMETLKHELEKTLGALRTLLSEMEPDKQEVIQISDAEFNALLCEVEPLLKKGDLAATNFVERLRSIAGMEELAEQIDEYNFEGALSLLESLRRA